MKIAVSVMLVFLVCLAFGGGGCLMEKKVIEVVVTGETCAEFGEDHDSPMFTTPAMVDYAGEIDRILQDNDLDRSDIEKAAVTSAWYTVTDFTQSTNWLITGEITVARNDVPSGTATVIEYTNQSIPAALGVNVWATLNSDGVDLLNQALSDYISGGAYPVMTFTVANGSVTPTPDPDNRMIFTWQACIKMQIVVKEDVELPQLF